MATSASGSKQHEWEVSTHEWESWPQRPIWEADSDGEIACGEKDAQDNFVMALLELKNKGRVSARDVCVLCYWAGKGGLGEEVQRMGMSPASQSGHFQRHLDTVLSSEAATEEYYELPLPGHSNWSLNRVTRNVVTKPAHEQLHAELATKPNLERELQARVRSKQMPPSYDNHPVVLANPDRPVWPVALYVDGVPFAKKDSLLLFVVYNMISDARHVVAILRKSDLCKCGCRGWCSIYPIFCFLRWSFMALAAGAFPCARHDDSAWQSNDSARSTLAGAALCVCAVMLLKGDWSEFCSTFGFPNWNHASHPCLLCWATQDNLRYLSGFNVLGAPQPLNTPDDYEAACARCEVFVLVYREHHLALMGILFDDKRPDGSRGRALRSDFPPLGLVAGDRLEPCSTLRDVGDFEKIDAYPAVVLFWRVYRQTAAHHRNPLFDKKIGITLNSFAIDTLHTLHLGVFKAFVSAAIWALVLNDVFDVGLGSQSQRHQLSFARIKHELYQWYKIHNTPKVYRLSTFHMSMFGTNDNVKVQTKGAETGTLLYFCVDALTKYQNRLRDPRCAALLEAGKRLTGFYDIVKAAPTRMSARQVQDQFRDFVTSAMLHTLSH